MSRFVRPETERLELTDGDWILVKRRLNAGEQRRAYNRIIKIQRIGPDGKATAPEIDPAAIGLGRMVEYLLDWSLVDDNDRVVLIRDQPAAVVEAALLALDPVSFGEIHDAILAHDTAQAELLAAEKKSRGTGSKLSVISSSVG
jgi:hypothetical protein